MTEYYKLVLWEGEITNANVVDVIQHYATQSGYNAEDYEWRGPLFKPNNTYMTAEGYPLGTTAWFVILEWGGRRPHLPRDTFLEAVQAAHQFIVDRVSE